MDTPLTGERLGEEKAFCRRYLEQLSNRPVNYAADYSPPLSTRPRKVGVVQTEVRPPPEAMDVDTPQGRLTEKFLQANFADSKVNLNIKSLKPALKLNVEASVSDSVADLKKQINAAGGPPADAQRLLLKGKVLADSKLLKEYDLTDGATIMLMAKPGGASPPAAAPAPSPSETLAASGAGAAVGAAAGAAGTKKDHPTLSPLQTADPTTPDSKHARKPSTPQLTVTTDGGEPGDLYENRGPPSPVQSTKFHSVVSDPTFWQKIHTVCHDEFQHARDADDVFDTFLTSMKNRLTANEAAKIRDVVGVSGELRTSASITDLQVWVEVLEYNVES